MRCPPREGVIMSRRPPPDDFHPEGMPITWCAELLMHYERGNFEATANAQRELRRLGWELRPVQKPARVHRAARQQGGMAHVH